MAVTAQMVRLVKRDARSPYYAIEASTVQDGIQIKKLDQDEQIVFGEVYAPDFPDSQGDYMSAREIKKMAYNFLQKGNVSNIDTNHSQVPNGSRVVESFIAREGDPIFTPGAGCSAYTWPTLPSGSWSSPAS